MKTVSIGELHAATGRIVRSVGEEPLVVTDRGRPVAFLTSSETSAHTVQPLPEGHWEGTERPTVDTESTLLICEDRER
jgi:antitoxin (DNA-binding transcriptional repressor) of toxin-antitoxin stability system